MFEVYRYFLTEMKGKEKNNCQDFVRFHSSKSSLEIRDALAFYDKRTHTAG